MGPVMGKERSALSVILLTFVTLGIYGLYWQYATFKEMKEHSGQGIGGGIGLLLAIFLSIVNCFLMPSEVEGLYQRTGRSSGISAMTGFWILLPIIGWIVWLVKTQGRLNEYWQSVAGAAPVPGAATAI
jgi:hypothetical protein